MTAVPEDPVPTALEEVFSGLYRNHHYFATENYGNRKILAAVHDRDVDKTVYRFTRAASLIQPIPDTDGNQYDSKREAVEAALADKAKVYAFSSPYAALLWALKI